MHNDAQKYENLVLVFSLQSPVCSPQSAIRINTGRIQNDEPLPVFNRESTDICKFYVGAQYFEPDIKFTCTKSKFPNPKSPIANPNSKITNPKSFIHLLPGHRKIPRLKNQEKRIRIDVQHVPVQKENLLPRKEIVCHQGKKFLCLQ